ncbi:hypothetical protein F5Y17DRAFT_421672 [Xylariaceae sp. FL0594]|nr:hypothetical protein F5Y17DRAFT_421672 [Xylariaceae sp. FL0594]
MDCDPPGTEGILATKPNGQRTNTQPSGPRHFGRKSTGNPESKENSIISDIDIAAPAIARPPHSNIPKHRPSNSLLARPTVSPSLSGRSDRSTAVIGTPAALNTRIPRPKTTVPLTDNHSRAIRDQTEESPKSPMRQPIDFKTAFSRAREQTDVDLMHAFNMANTELDDFRAIDGSPSPAPRLFRRQSQSRVADNLNSGARLEQDDLGKKLAHFDRAHKLDGGGGPLNGLFSKNRAGTSIPRAGRASNGQVSNNNQNDRVHQDRKNATPHSPLRAAYTNSEAQRLPTVGSHSTRIGVDVPIPTIESEFNGSARPSPAPEQFTFSPEKDVNWHLDADFTAGDLQISGSPRVTLTKASAETSRKPDGIEQAGLRASVRHQSDEKLRQIRQREVEAEKTTFAQEMAARKQRAQCRLDEIKARETEASSRRALASSRLDEIRISNSESRSESPESRTALRTTPPKGEIARPSSQPMAVTKTGSNPERAGEPVRHTPVVVYKSTSERPLGQSQRDAPVRSDSHDVLRRLARATSSSPSDKDNAEKEGKPETEARDDAAPAKSPPKSPAVSPVKAAPEVQQAEARNLDRSSPRPEATRVRHLENKNPKEAPEVEQSKVRNFNRSPPRREETRPRHLEIKNPKEAPEVQQSEPLNVSRSSPRREGGRLRHLEIKNPKDRPTVGFAHLTRVPSDDLVQGKRPSKPNSEIDPIDRIEAELSLFAPSDKSSEWGSNRAPSPVHSEPPDEETPRPVRVDPLSMPTPRVTGAYVETPATVRVKEEGARPKPSDLPAVIPEAKPSSLKSSLSPTKRSSGSSVAERARSLRRSSSRSSSVPALSRRARSASRRRRPLINTARPPTVREDILAILRANDIEDSTLENLGTIFAGQDLEDTETERAVSHPVPKVEGDGDRKLPEVTDPERELDERIGRLNRGLETGLLGIRSAKKGIERLEDKIIHHERKDEQTRAKPTIKKASTPESPPLPMKTDSVPVYVPRLYHRHPRFKLTPWGILALLALIWYALESTFSLLYAAPAYACIPNLPCGRSPDEPYFPYTMPFMLDEWATGGKGRALALKMGEEIGDMVAEVSDWATNTDFTRSDTRFMDVWQRKRHLRRLRKHGLVPKWTPPEGYRPRYREWQAVKEAREAVARDLDLDGEDETMSADEVVW